MACLFRSTENVSNELGNKMTSEVDNWAKRLFIQHYLEGKSK